MKNAQSKNTENHCLQSVQATKSKILANEKVRYHMILQFRNIGVDQVQNVGYNGIQKLHQDGT